MAAQGPFSVLADPKRRTQFDDGLLELLCSLDYRIIGVVLDKTSHEQKRYRSLTHPYHYCLHAMADRYCGMLNFRRDVGDVMAESRGKLEDAQLKSEYADIWANGTRFTGRARTQATLRSRQLKLKPKIANSAGLQLADMLAHPITRDVLLEHGHSPDRGGPFADRLCQAVDSRYNRRYMNDQVRGYGKVFLD